MAGKAFENISKIFLTDTFRAWFDKTNQIINTINPLQIYGVTAATGENAGITVTIGTDGIATVGISFPRSLTGDFVFGGGVTFTEDVNISGLTLDLNPEGSTGATVYGRVVRTFNGMTGDVTFTSVGGPSGITSGDILYYDAAGTTYVRYPLFADGTADADFISVGRSGGVYFGMTAGAASAANSVLRQGHIQLVGSTASLIYMNDGSDLSFSSSKTGGAELRYGKEGSTGPHLFAIGGRSLSGIRSAYDNFTINFDTKRVSIGGITSPAANLSINDNASGKIMEFFNSAGATMNMRFITGASAGGRTSGGATGISAYGGHPATKGLKEENRYRFEQLDGSVEFEITGSGRTSGFMIYGSDSQNGFGTLLTPTLHARRDGNVVIGGLSSLDGGVTGSTHGSLNIVSGKLYAGGTLGATDDTGMRVLASNGSSAGWRNLASTVSYHSGSVSKLQDVKIDNTGDLTYTSSNKTSTIQFEDESGVAKTGAFSVTVNFPLVRLVGSHVTLENAVIGVIINVDGVQSEMSETIKWKDLFATGVETISPTFVASGFANDSVEITPFATLRDRTEANTGLEGFKYLSRGTYLATFDRIG